MDWAFWQAYLLNKGRKQNKNKFGGDYLKLVKKINNENLIIICSVKEQWEADLIKSLLQSEGIFVIQKPSASLAQLHYPPVMMNTDIKILVPKSKAKESLELIKKTEP